MRELITDHIGVITKVRALVLKVHLMTISSIGIGTMYQSVMVLLSMMSLTIVQH